MILPVKGCRSHSQENWASQLAMSYPGSLEYLFVLDSQSDPAFAAIQAWFPISSRMYILKGAIWKGRP